MSKSHSMILKYLIMSILAGVLCFLFPYTGDDWAWGSDIGLIRLSKWFDNYNGRYVGNLIVLALTRSRLLRAVVMSITFTGIAYCIERITQRCYAFTVALSGLLLLPRLIFRQAVVWTSGFANYATCTFFTLVYFVYLNEHRPEENNSVSLIICIFLGTLGICNTLIVENMTIFHVIISVCLFLYSVRIHKQIRADYLIYMISCISGAVYMFSNTIFHTMTVNPNTYYHIAEEGIIYQALKNYFGMIYHEGYFNNHFINILMFAVCFLLFRQFRRSHSQKRLMSISAVCLVIMTVFLLCSLISFILYGYSYIDYDHLVKVGIEGCISFIGLIAAIVLSLITTYKDGINKNLVFLWFSFIWMIAPLFEGSPIGPRCFFSSYIVLTLIICEEMKCISFEQAKVANRIQRSCTAGSAVLIALCTMFYFRVFFTVYQAEKQREQHIQEEVAAGQKTIELSHLPYEDWLWWATITDDNGGYESRFKLFYGIPDDIDVIVADSESIDE